MIVVAAGSLVMNFGFLPVGKVVNGQRMNGFLAMLLALFSVPALVYYKVPLNIVGDNYFQIMLTCIAFSAWAALATLALLRGIDLVLPLRAGGQTVPQSCDGSAVPVLEKNLPITENFQELQMPGRWSVAPQKYAKYI